MKRLLLHSLSISALLLIGILLFTASCKKDGDTAPAPAANIALSGVVVDEAQKAVASASVVVDGHTTTSDDRGYFSIETASATDGRYVIKVSKANYFNSVVGVTPGKANTRTVLTLTALKDAKAFTAGTTTTLTLDGGMKIDMPAGFTKNGAAFTGTAKAFVRYVSPADTNLPAIMPGGDFAGLDASGAKKVLTTYGAVLAQLQDAGGNNLELAAGNTATLRFPAGTSTLTTIPLWHFDETSGLWKEEGSATLVGNEYVGTVSHFSSWNLDMSSGQGIIKGIVKDCAGNPVSGVRIQVGQKTVMSADDGSFVAAVPSGQTHTVSTTWDAGNVTIQAPTLPEGQVVEVVLPCIPTTTGKLVSCAGSPISGSVVLTTVGEKFISYAEAGSDGRFSIAGPANQQLVLRATNRDGLIRGNLNVTMPSLTNQPSEQAPLHLCDSIVDSTLLHPNNGTFGFTLDGDGHNHEVYLLGNQSQSLALAYRSPSSDITTLIANKVSNGTTLSAQLLFGGAPGPRTILANGADSSLFSLSILPPTGAANLTTYITDEDHLVSISITEYGPIGSHIRGTFSGKLLKASAANPGDTGTVRITNGALDIIRGQDL